MHYLINNKFKKKGRVNKQILADSALNPIIESPLSLFYLLSLSSRELNKLRCLNFHN